MEDSSKVTADDPRTYKQWVKINIRNKTEAQITLKDFDLKYGKFFRYPNGFDEEVDAPEGQTIEVGKTFSFASCGRANSPSGTECRFSIYGPRGEIARYYWDCPFTGTNKFDLEMSDEDYMMQDKGFNRTANGALGEGTITIAEF